LKPIDKVTLGVMSKLPGRNESKRIGGLENRKFWRPSLRPIGEGSMSKRRLADTFVSLQRGDSDGMVARTYQATGEALLDGFVVAMSRGNARGAKEPYC
jgi:hypothetical protein